MAKSINKAILVGNISSDITLRKTSSGTSVAHFSMATNHSVKNGDTWEEMATFHNIVAWSSTAEYLEKYASKGMKLYVEGRIQNSSYEKDGNKYYKSEIVANEVVLMSKNEPAQNFSKPVESSSVDEDDTPF
jgi:single-strand DNA-binding protein